jgi:DnaJ-class molecular chaperone
MERVKCPRCLGDGKCRPCSGKGYVSTGKFPEGIKDRQLTECRLCGGTGKCERCGGKGYIEK